MKPDYLPSSQQTPMREQLGQLEDNETIQLSDTFLDQSANKNEKFDVKLEFNQFQEKMQKIMKLSEI